MQDHKTIRDPVHGDIRVNRIEVRLLDTQDFQRLRKIKQLGSTHLVFTGAVHSRFDHSIGTLYMACRMLDRIRMNPKPVKTIAERSYCELLTRTCALLHDVAHIPFGHTLDDEGQLFHSQWKSKDRREHFLGDKSEIASVLRDWIGPQFLQDVRDVLFACDEEEGHATEAERDTPEPNFRSPSVDKLPFPFVYDIVGNTICADLLDYLRRDSYFSGLRDNYDDRFLSYLVIADDPKTHSARLVLRLYKPTTRTSRRDVVSELMHLLDLRYSVAEKLYYQHSKMSASAMLVEAVVAARKVDPGLDQFLLITGDDELIGRLQVLGSLHGRGIAETAKEGEKPPASRTRAAAVVENILRELSTHRIYRPAYAVSYDVETADEEDETSTRGIRKRFGNESVSPGVSAEARYKKARELEADAELDPGSVVLYCPPQRMGEKVFTCRVQKRNSDIVGLDSFKVDGVDEEVDRIRTKHRMLWRFVVFSSRCKHEGEYTHNPKKCDECEKRANLRVACEREFKLPNQLSSLIEGSIPVRVYPSEKWVRWGIEWGKDNANEPPVTLPELAEITSIAEGYGDPFSKEDFDRELRRLRAGRGK